MTAPVADQRVLVGVAAQVVTSFMDQDGEPTAALGAVTVDVTAGDGSVVATGAAVTSTGTTQTYALPAQSALNFLTLVWKDAGVTRMTTHVDVVGGYYFSVAQARAFDDAITTDLATNARIIATRHEVEVEAERLIRRSFVPRYRRILCIGGGDELLRTGVRDVRSIRSVRTFNFNGTTYIDHTPAQLAAIRTAQWGGLTRLDGFYWPVGQTVAVELEHGWDRPPPDLLHAVLTRLLSRLYMETTGIPDRAISYTPVEGGSFAIATPGRNGFDTGIPDVDAVYQGYSVKPTMTSVPIT